MIFLEIFGKNACNVRMLVYQKYENDTKKTFHFEDPTTKTSFRDVPINKQCALALKKAVYAEKVVESKAPMIRKPEQQFGDLLFTMEIDAEINQEF